jgi:hypothetical protein
MPALSRAIGSGRARLGERPSRAQAQARHAVDPACCAPAATGHTTAPPSSVMTSRRLSSGRDARFIARPPPRSARAAFPHAAPTSVYDGESGRIRSSAFVTRAWLWVQYVLCWCAFPLAPALRSTDSAASTSEMPPQWASFALFAGFTATMARSDFSRPCIIGFGSSPSRRGPSLSRNA